MFTARNYHCHLASSLALPPPPFILPLVNRVHLRPILFTLIGLSLASLLGAADAAKSAASPAPVGPVIDLPTMKVQEKRIKVIDAELKKLDKQIAREKKQMKSTNLDKSLNSDKVSNAAAILGGNSASHMAAVAATRVGLLEQERMLLERLKFPRTEKDQALIEKELANNRTTRRNLDNVPAQR